MQTIIVFFCFRAQIQWCWHWNSTAPHYWSERSGWNALWRRKKRRNHIQVVSQKEKSDGEEEEEDSKVQSRSSETTPWWILAGNQHKLHRSRERWQILLPREEKDWKRSLSTRKRNLLFTFNTWAFIFFFTRLVFLCHK